MSRVQLLAKLRAALVGPRVHWETTGTLPPYTPPAPEQTLFDGQETP